MSQIKVYFRLDSTIQILIHIQISLSRGQDSIQNLIRTDRFPSLISTSLSPPGKLLSINIQKYTASPNFWNGMRILWDDEAQAQTSPHIPLRNPDRGDFHHLHNEETN